MEVELRCASVRTAQQQLHLAEGVAKTRDVARVLTLGEQGQRPIGERDGLSHLFFFQAEDGIRDDLVTGVQTCALPISATPDAATAPPDSCPPPPAGMTTRSSGPACSSSSRVDVPAPAMMRGSSNGCTCVRQIGRASCRERV